MSWRENAKAWLKDLREGDRLYGSDVDTYLTEALAALEAAEKDASALRDSIASLRADATERAAVIAESCTDADGNCARTIAAKIRGGEIDPVYGVQERKMLALEKRLADAEKCADPVKPPDDRCGRCQFCLNERIAKLRDEGFAWMAAYNEAIEALRTIEMALDIQGAMVGHPARMAVQDILQKKREA